MRGPDMYNQLGEKCEDFDFGLTKNTRIDFQPSMENMMGNHISILIDYLEDE